MTRKHINTIGRVSRRRFLIGAAGLTGAVALSACAAPPAAAPSASVAAPTAAQVTGGLVVTGERNGTTDGLDIAPAPPPAASAYPRTVTDVLGRQIEFKTRPTRVTMNTNRYALDELLLLGITPIAFQVSDSEELAPWTKDALARLDATLVNFNGKAYPTPPNLELLATLKPDLIVMLHFSGGSNTKPEDYELFSLYEKIAPVFFVEYTDLEAQRLRMLAEVFAVEDKVAEIQARDAALFEAVTPPPAGVELAVGFGYKGSAGVSSQVYNGGASELATLERVGFTIKDYGRPKGERSFDPSEENLTILDADMLWNVAPYPGDNSAQDFEASKIVQNLQVVREGRYRSLNSDQSQAILFWTPLATPFLVKTLNELVASYSFEGTGAPAAVYPRTIRDSTGVEVTIPTRPERVVTLQNLWDLDALLSLGIAPVQFGIRSFVGQYTGSEKVSWQWHEDALKRLGATAERMNGDEPNLEVIAQTKPDLIIGMPWNLETGRDAITKLAPAVALKVDWRESLKLAGQVFGEEEKAARIIAETDNKIATALTDLNMGAKTIAIISCYEGNKAFFGFGHPADGRADLFQRAGFTLLDAISAKATADKPVPEFSIELLSILDPADVIVLFDYGNDGTNASGIQENPLFMRIPAVQEGRLFVAKQGELAQGLSTISPINLDFCLNVVRQAAALAMKA
jgi:iron complex transport system substrate-binding protein